MPGPFVIAMVTRRKNYSILPKFSGQLFIWKHVENYNFIYITLWCYTLYWAGLGHTQVILRGSGQTARKRTTTYMGQLCELRKCTSKSCAPFLYKLWNTWHSVQLKILISDSFRFWLQYMKTEHVTNFQGWHLLIVGRLYLASLTVSFNC